MNFTESLKQAFENLKMNKLRSFLTMLGIVMGVFSVITILEIGNAAKSYMDNEFEKLGTNVIDISYKNRNVDQDDWLKIEDINTIIKVVPEIKNIAGISIKSGSIRLDSKTKDAQVYGATPQYKYFKSIEMTAGRFISDVDIFAQSNVVVITKAFAVRYFGKADVIGEILNLRNSNGDNIRLRIIGVMKEEDGIFGSAIDNDMIPTTVIMPLTAAQKFYSSSKLDAIKIAVPDKNKLSAVGTRIIKLLEFKNKAFDTYIAQSAADMQKTLTSMLDVVSSVLLVIAFITLVVGGIGIINILLVSVTERIREIGIRKALGAKKSDIVYQFLTESIVMTSFSGLLGIILGIGAGGFISYMIKIPPVVDIKIIILSFIGSVTLGIIFGVYPATKAADLDPIESLRYE